MAGLLTASLTGCQTAPAVTWLLHPEPAVRFLTGAGSTFDYPFFLRSFYDYNQEQHIEVNYQPIGSGGGILQLIEGTVSFGATDVPMNHSELARAQAAHGPVLQLPVTLAAEAIAYNVPGIHVRLRFSGAALADIFLGRITRWNNRLLTALNPGVALPDLPILVVHRSDGSGTTYIFTDYLSHVSRSFAAQVGTGTAVAWPVGVGEKGNTAVAQTVQTTPGAIGYVELSYVLTTHIAYAAVENAAHRYILPSLAGATAAAEAIADVTARHYSIVNAPGAASYPICGYSWIVIYRDQRSTAKARALSEMLHWLITTAQKKASTVGNAPLPASARAFAARQIVALRVVDKAT